MKKKLPDTEENRNVMLNASSNSGPREVNIGLPSSVGGITVLENDLPVVYHFWPELPMRTWRPSQSLDMKGLISVSESTLTIADFGYAVNSYTKTGGEKTLKRFPILPLTVLTLNYHSGCYHISPNYLHRIFS